MGNKFEFDFDYSELKMFAHYIGRYMPSSNFVAVEYLMAYGVIAAVLFTSETSEAIRVRMNDIIKDAEHDNEVCNAMNDIFNFMFVIDFSEMALHLNNSSLQPVIRWRLEGYGRS